MYELFTVLCRYLMVAYGAHLTMKYGVDESIIEPLIGAGMTVIALGWMVFTRFFSKEKEEK